MNSDCLNKTFRVAVLGLSLAAGSLAMTGCGNSVQSVHYNPSPELFTRDMTYDQNMANFSVSINRDLRATVDDFQRAFMWDKASRMNKTPNPW